jgi:CelD/BcsL family acetyltransferase involved in cellulose biosynthesis
VLTEKIRNAETDEFAKNRSIPVLTDIQPTSAKPASSTTALLDKLPWDELESRLTGQIRKQVMERLNVVLDDNISQHVSSVLKQIAVMLAEEIKYDMQNTLEVIVTHTISAELQRLKKKELTSENNNTSSEI